MLVADIMRTEIVTCDVDASLRGAGRRMLDEGVGSVIVTRDGTPLGIVTETDALQAGVATDRPFGDIALGEVASHPLLTTTPDATVRKAVERMREEGVKKLPVMEDMELRGIVTRSDVTAHYGDFIREVHELEGMRERWEARRTDPDEF